MLFFPSHSVNDPPLRLEILDSGKRFALWKV
jgi:hypothetical protein